MSLFVDPAADEPFRPAINPSSRHMGLASLAERQAMVTATHKAKVEQLADAVEMERRQAETFRPAINANSAHVESRFDKPRAPATNHDDSSEARAQREMQGGPNVNPRSRELASDQAARQDLERVTLLRRRLRRVWSAHAESTTMSDVQVRPVLEDLGVGVDELTVAKFKAALGVGHGSDASYVEYDRFMKVFEAVLSQVASPARRGGGSGPQTHGSQQPRPSHAQVAPRPTRTTITGPLRSPNAMPTTTTTTAVARPARTVAQPPKAAGRVTQPTGEVPSSTRTPSAAPKTRTPAAATPASSSAVASKPGSSSSAMAQRSPNVYVPKEVREARECTFAPKIHSTRPPAPVKMGPQSDAKGFAETVERMERARQTRKPSFDEQLRNGSVPKGAAQGPGGKFAPTKAKPFNLRLSTKPHDRTTPFLFVDVELPTGRLDRIPVFHGDTAEALASSFAAKHGLDAGIREKLVALLKAKIKEHRALDADKALVGERQRSSERALSASPEQRQSRHPPMPPATSTQPLVVPVRGPRKHQRRGHAAAAASPESALAADASDADRPFTRPAPAASGPSYTAHRDDGGEDERSNRRESYTARGDGHPADGYGHEYEYNDDDEDIVCFEEEDFSPDPQRDAAPPPLQSARTSAAPSTTRSIWL